MATFYSFNNFGTTQLAETTNNLTVVSDGGASTPFMLGQKYAIYWFESLNNTNNSVTLTEGMKYGMARTNDWVLKNGTSNEGNLDLTGNIQESASLTVTAVPEPSSSLLLGLGALGFLTRRKKS